MTKQDRIIGLRATLDVEPDKTTTIEGIADYLVHVASGHESVDVASLSPFARLVYSIALRHLSVPVRPGDALIATTCPTCRAVDCRSGWAVGACESCDHVVRSGGHSRLIEYLADQPERSACRSDVLRAMRVSAAELDGLLAWPVGRGMIGVEKVRPRSGPAAVVYRLLGG